MENRAVFCLTRNRKKNARNTLTQEFHPCKDPVHRTSKNLWPWENLTPSRVPVEQIWSTQSLHMTCHITAEDLMHAGLTKSNSGAQIFDFPKFSHRLSITILRTVGATVNNARAFTLSGCTVHVNHCKCSSILLSIADFQAIRAALNPLHNTLCCTHNSTTASE